jgi:hypothetical protein
MMKKIGKKAQERGLLFWVIVVVVIVLIGAVLAALWSGAFSEGLGGLFDRIGP